MMINRIGAKFEYKGTTYVIGAPIVGTSESEYEGLYGTMERIRKRKTRRRTCIALLKLLYCHAK